MKARTIVTAPAYAFVLLVLVASAVAGTGAAKKVSQAEKLFETSDRCMACHNGIVTATGEDISIGTHWRTTMMANAARDPYWQAGVRREIADHPGSAAAIEGECSICHMPMARTTAHAAGAEGRVFAHLPVTKAKDTMDAMAADGVSCSLCHQIEEEGLGEPSSFVGGFVIDTQAPWGSRFVYGPFDVDEGRAKLMSSSSGMKPEEAFHLMESGMCATCHTLMTKALGPAGEVVGTLPEQVPFLEWKHSRYPGTESCQDCHMATVGEDVHITSVWGTPRQGFRQHVFRGGNFFVQRLLNRYRNDLGTVALPQELSAAGQGTIDHLESLTARLLVTDASVKDGVLAATVQVENLAGHKLPTAYPSRRVFIRFVVRDAKGEVIFESGAIGPDGSIAGNDNDGDPLGLEPHHAVIDSPDQVQIYEAIMGSQDGAVTTGLLDATHYIKDNRLLPEGFDRATASADVAVHGEALADPDFIGGADRVLFNVALGSAQGPFEITAQLFYQPIGYRWAMNLAGYEAPEPQRFVAYYVSAAQGSAALVASDVAIGKAVVP